MSTPTAPVSSAEQAYAWVRTRILDGKLEGGVLISEGEVAEALGMSRTPVREAFLRLQAEGWMRLYPKRGALVVPVAPREAREVVEARALIESHAVRSVVADPQAARILAARLMEIVEQQRAALARDDLATLVSADADFHRAIVAAGGNSLLETFYAGLRDRQRRMTTRSLRGRGERAARVISDHAGLADRVLAGDAEGFTAALTAHITETHRELLA